MNSLKFKKYTSKYRITKMRKISVVFTLIIVMVSSVLALFAVGGFFISSTPAGRSKTKDSISAQDVDSGQPSSLEESNAASPTYTAGNLHQVVSVVDGDTIKVSINGQKETIRFIGMDTPETRHPGKPVQCFGKEASSRMQHYVQSKKVRLEVDSSQGDRDRYGRLLRYVYIESGENVAYLMIKEGYAHEYTYNKPYKYQANFKAAEQYAIKNSLGLWSSSTCKGDTEKPASADNANGATVDVSSDPMDGAVYYKNCTEARAAGAAPIYKGQPGYSQHLDRDQDGIACE